MTKSNKQNLILNEFYAVVYQSYYYHITGYMLGSCGPKDSEKKQRVAQIIQAYTTMIFFQKKHQEKLVTIYMILMISQTIQIH